MSLAQRLWTYQAERFPLAKTVPLLAVFSAASVAVSAHLADRPLPGLGAFLAAFVVVFVLFFQMRVADEFKDAEDDAKYRPERPVPRGLVTLELLGKLSAATGFVAILLVLLTQSFAVKICLLLTLLWLFAMTREFGVPDWLKARPMLYLVSHMAIMPLIDLLLTAFEWGRWGAAAPGLWTFLLLSFLNGCVLEIGRKLWAPENEREGVETYSGLWGPARASMHWLCITCASAVPLLFVGFYTGVLLPMALVAALGLSLCGWAALGYKNAPTPAAEKRLDTMAGIWVLLCYASAGGLPLLFGG